MSKAELRQDLVAHGFDPSIVNQFIETCTLRIPTQSRLSGPQPLMEAIIIGRNTGGYGFSWKAANIFIDIPRILGGTVTLGGGAIFATQLNSITIMLGIIAFMLGAKVPLNSSHAAVAFALHRAGAYASKSQYVSENEILTDIKEFAGEWSIAPLDALKLNEAINQLRIIRAIDILDGRYALKETVVALPR